MDLGSDWAQTSTSRGFTTSCRAQNKFARRTLVITVCRVKAEGKAKIRGRGLLYSIESLPVWLTSDVELNIVPSSEGFWAAIQS